MSKINEAVYVDCPPERAKTYLLNHFESTGRHHGNAIIPLTATIGSGAGTHVTVTRDAIATLASAPGGSGLEYQVRIEWTPTTKEPLPKFDGVFHVQWDEEFGKCRLVLDGEYDPPLGVVGKAFDAAVGHQIAQNTVRSLLETLRSDIELAYRKDVPQG
jgi:hypothetical protein